MNTNGKPGCGCGGAKSVASEMPSDVKQFLGEAVRNRSRATGEFSPTSSTIEGAARRAIADVSQETFGQHISAPGIEQAAQRALRDVPGSQS